MNLRDFSKIEERRHALEVHLNVPLPHIGDYSIDADMASSRNCENMIGVMQIPVGVAGPLLITSKNQSREVYVPLATTEGALVASVSRGCKAVFQSGGAAIITKKIGITRAPVFAVKNINEGQKLIEYTEKNFTKLKELAGATSTHLTLLDITSWRTGKNIFLRMRFDSQDAMGMNMATIAATAICEHLEKQTSAKLVAVSGNLCVDKKPNALNFILGRGISVWADITIPERIIRSVLKSTSEKITETAERKLVYGSVLSGSIGQNAHMANILAAIFLATGQDVAHIAECANGVTSVEKTKGGLYVSIYLPDLIIGTVGGGTGLATQKEALSLLGVAGGSNGKNAEKLAEIIGGAVLAGELSLLASLSENSLSRAHIVLGRGGKE